MCPSVSFLFRSVNAVFGKTAVGVLLTGMGVDGVEELKRLKEAGALTIAQDAVSSIVHGMPGQAIKIGAGDSRFAPGGHRQSLNRPRDPIMNTNPIRSPIEILIAEDSPTQAEQLRYILENRDFRVVVTRNGREALEAMQARKPTLVITDINMPEMDGYELCRRIRADEALADVPVILLTSLADSEDVFKGLECGADNFITKPYEENNLLARVHYLLANIHLRNQESMQISMEVFLAGQRHVITSSRAQILNLLLSTYEAAVQKNRELARAHNDLARMNEQLEEKVVERTASLSAEIAERQNGRRKQWSCSEP